LGVRYDVPPLKKETTLRILFPKNNKYELQYVEYDFSGWKDGDKVSMFRNNETIFQNLFTKELAQRVSVRPVVRLNPDEEYIMFKIYNDTGTSKVLWLDLGLVSANPILNPDTILPDLEIFPKYKKIGYGSTYQFTAFATADPGIAEDVNFLANWEINSPATVKDGLASNLVDCKQYNVLARYNEESSSAILEVVNAVLIEPSYKKVGQNHPYTFKVSTFDNLAEVYKENPQLVTLTITEPAQINADAKVTRTSEVKMHTIYGTYNGNTVIAHLDVVEGLKLVPNQKIIGTKSTFKFDAMQFEDTTEEYKNVSSEVSWKIDLPSIINNVGNTSNNLVPGNYNVEATDNYSNKAKGILYIVPNFKVDPNTQTVDEEEIARFYAVRFNNQTEQYEDVSSLCQWSSDLPLDVLDNGLVKTSRHGKYLITATNDGDSDTGILKVQSIYVPNPPYKLEPPTNKIQVAESCTFSALYYDRVLGDWVDVTEQSVWNIINRGTGIVINQLGSVSNPDTEGTFEVYAEYNQLTANGNVVVAPVVIDHDYNYKVTMRWLSKDYDLRCKIYLSDGTLLSDVGFNNPTYTSPSGTVWLDLDNRFGGTEIITVLDNPGNYVIFYVQNYQAPTVMEVTCDISTRGGSVLGSKIINSCEVGQNIDIFKLDLGNGTVTVL
jgi:hypothetical protein